MGTLFTIFTVIGFLLFLMTVLTITAFFKYDRKEKRLPRIFEYNWLVIWVTYTGLVFFGYGLVKFITLLMNTPILPFIIGGIIIITLFWAFRKD